MSKTWTVLEVLQKTTEIFAGRNIDTARLDAELLLAHALGVDRIQLYVRYDKPLSEEERAPFRKLVGRRARGEPTQYLLGKQEFWSIEFQVEPGVLVPRPDTEVLVEEALVEARRLGASAPLAIADVGTGSGAIAVALASELPAASLWASDIEAKPVEVATGNARRAGVGERVTIIQADGLLPLWQAHGEQPFHLVVSNPPYIREDVFPSLDRTVRDFEPRSALVGGADGLDVCRRIIEEATRPGVLHPEGALIIEIGDPEQAQTVSQLMAAHELADTRVRDDYGGRPRVVVGVRQNR